MLCYLKKNSPFWQLSVQECEQLPLHPASHPIQLVPTEFSSHASAQCSVQEKVHSESHPIQALIAFSSQSARGAVIDLNSPLIKFVIFKFLSG